MEKESKHINHIEAIRGIACIMVILFHFVASFEGAQGQIIKSKSFREAFYFCAQGVELFYIISGFVIFYSLKYSNFNLGVYHKYLLKRLIRIFIPFLGAVIIILLTAMIWKGDYPYSAKMIIENVTLTVDLLNDEKWLNPIFVTLKVEIIFYVFIALFVPLMRQSLVAYFLVLVAGLFSVFVFNHVEIVHNLPFFLMGIAICECYFERAKILNILYILVCLLVLAIHFPREDFLVAVLGVTLLLIVKINFKPLVDFGKYSYSTFLVHGLTGGLFLFCATNENYFVLNTWLAISLAILIGVGCGYLYHLVIEKRAIKWSKAIKY